MCKRHAELNVLVCCLSRVIFVVVGHRRNIFNDENFPIYGIYICTCRRTEQGCRQRWRLRTPNSSRKIGNYRRGIIKSDGEEHTAHIFNTVNITIVNLYTLKLSHDNNGRSICTHLLNTAQHTSPNPLHCPIDASYLYVLSSPI